MDDIDAEAHDDTEQFDDSVISRPGQPESRYEALLHKMGRLRADANRLERRLTASDVSGDLMGQLVLLSDEVDTVTRSVIEYLDSDDETPEDCPVCGREITPFEEVAAGESYAVDQVCIEETGPTGSGSGFLHLAGDDE